MGAAPTLLAPDPSGGAGATNGAHIAAKPQRGQLVARGAGRRLVMAEGLRVAGCTAVDPDASPAALSSPQHIAQRTPASAER